MEEQDRQENRLLESSRGFTHGELLQDGGRRREMMGMRRTPRLRLDGRGRRVSRLRKTRSCSSTQKEKTYWHLISARTIDQPDETRRLTLFNIWHPQPASSTGTKIKIEY